MDELCPKRLLECNYCELSLPVNQFAEHVEFCGSCAEKCLLCQTYVMVKDKLHDEIHWLENKYRTKSIEDEIKHNKVNEVISKKSTAKKMCEKPPEAIQSMPSRISEEEICVSDKFKNKKCKEERSLEIPAHERGAASLPGREISKRFTRCHICKQSIAWIDFNTHVPVCASIAGKWSVCAEYVPSDEIKELMKIHFQAKVNTSFNEKKKQSSSSQADVSESVIDKENAKYQELSSLDTKDVTLLAESMKELLIKGNDHDMKITVKDKKFQAHSIILRTRSPVFAMMLTHDSKESLTGTINIEDCDPDSFDEFLLYLYSGRTGNLTPAKALHLYYTADKYDVPALKERCAILLKTSLSVESICDVLFLATRHNEKELLEEATKFFAQNMREILVTAHWQKFLSDHPIEGNELYIKSMEILIPRK